MTMYKKGGLAHFNSGGGAEESDEAPMPVMTKPVKVTSKSGLQIPSASGDVPLSKGVLDAMEQLYQDRQAQYGGFLEGVKDAYAWWSGDIEGPQKALAQRAEERSRQSADLFNIRTQIAQNKAAQERNAQIARSLQDSLDNGGVGTFRYDPATATEIQRRLKVGDVAGAEKVQSSFITEGQKMYSNPASYKPDIGYIDTSTGSPRPDIQSSIDARSRILASGAAPGARPPTEAAPRPLPQAQGAAPQGAAPQGMAPAPKAAAPQGAAPAPAPMAAAPQGAAPAPAPAPTPRQAPTPATMTTPGQPAPAPVAQPSLPTTVPSRVSAKPSLLELQTAQEVRKATDIEAGKVKLETDKKARESYEKEADPKSVTERLTRAKRVEELVMSDPTVVGVLTQPDVKSAIANVISQGISTPSGSVSVKGLSEAIFQTLPTTMNLAKRREIAGYLAQMELDTAQLIQGQGQVSDSEREIIRAGSISIEDPAELVVKKARVMQARQETLRKLNEIYGDGSRYVTNFTAFKNDPRYKSIVRSYEDRLRGIMSEEVKLDRSQVGKMKGPAKGSAPKTKAYDDPEKERRYQEFKKSQGLK